jgi:hypothetical protein
MNVVYLAVWFTIFFVLQCPPNPSEDASVEKKAPATPFSSDRNKLTWGIFVHHSKAITFHKFFVWI